MIVTVEHGETNRDTFLMEDHKPIARFNFEADSIEEALELAYRYTQNLMDSWSRPGGIDAHATVEVLQPLPVYNGEEFGHRSSMVGDILDVTDIDGSDHVQRYVVATFGFDRIN